MEEKVIFEVDVTSLSKAVLQAQADLTSYNIALQDSIELNGKFSEETVQAKAAVDAQTKSVKAAEGALVRVTQAEKALGGSLKDIVKSYDATNKSIDQNRKALNALTAEYVKTVNPSKEFTARIKNISDTLKQQEGAIGDTRRNVGNYFNEFAKGIPGLGAAIEPLKNIGGAFQNIGINAAGFQAAFLAGIPLIIAGLQGAFTVAQKFDSVVEGLEDTMMGLNRTFDDLIANGNKPFTGFKQLYEDLKNSYNAGVELSQVLRELGEAQDRQRVLDAAANKDVTNLLLKAKDRTKSEQERIKFLDEASAKEEANLKIQLDLANQREQIAGRELRRVIEAGLNDDKQKKALNDAAVSRINLETESANLQEKIINRRNQLLDEIQKKEEKLSEEKQKALKRDQENEIAIAEENERIRQDFEKRKQEEINLAREQNREARAMELSEEKEFQDAQLKQASEYLAARAAEERKLVEATRVAEAEKQQYQKASLQAASSISDDIISLIGQVADAQSEGAEFAKALAFVQILTQQAIAIATAVTGATESGAATGPAAIGSIPAFIATLVGAVLAVVGGAIGLLSKPVPKKNFATGVIGLDGEGTETSDSIDARLSKGESVMTAKATKRYHRELAAMEWSVGNKPNYQFGNKRFATGFIPQVSSDGGFTARETMKQSDLSVIMREAIKSGFAAAPAPKLSIVELESKQKDRNRSVKVSEL